MIEVPVVKEYAIEDHREMTSSQYIDPQSNSTVLEVDGVPAYITNGKQ